MSEELCYLGAREALARFEARSLSPVELLDALVARAERVEPHVRAFTHTFYDSARAAARRAEERYARAGRRRRPLEGLPLAVKDESAIAGQPLTQGSLLHRDQVARETSPSIERLLRAGAIVHARTATPEFSCAGVTHSRLHGVTRNPWHLASTPGGSSGGSGAALAAGTTPLATGTDIWGSIRIPASCCGVVGLKPSHGRIPTEAPFNLDPYNHEGPMARSVADCALLLDVMCGPHPRDAASLRPKLRIPSRPEALGAVSGWRVAWSPDLGFAAVDPSVARNTERALDVFRQLGCQVERVELGWGDEVRTAAVEHLLHLFGTSVLREIARDRDGELTPYARDFGERARNTTAEGFLRSLEVAGAMYETLGPILERHHVFVCPTTALPALPAGHDPTRDPVHVAGRAVDPVFGWILTWPFNVLGRCPVISVPSGLDPEGVPTGIQIVARHYDDLRVLHAAAGYERALGGFPRLSWRDE